MYCKNCGAQINENDKFCSNCGTEVITPERYCTYCGTKIAENSETCQNCGRLVNKQSDANKGTTNTQQNTTTSTNENIQKKSRIAAGILGILLGSFGVHNFYLGYTGKAVAQLLITVCTCGLGGVVSEIWGLIEGIMILCGSINVDGKGNLLGE